MIPMSLSEKLEFFKLLCKIGFKEIEVGFPAASEKEYTFLRTLIEEAYERLTRMHIYDRQPYAGKLVFAAFSGSHQDAIAKSMKF